MVFLLVILPIAQGIDLPSQGDIIIIDPIEDPIPASDRTADMPDSWLVLYNENNADSITWKDWYIDQWDIPEENTLGLNVSSTEKILDTEFYDKILNPVRDYITNNPDIGSKIMGILVGYRVPGNFYHDADSPIYQGGGGWSVSNFLQNLDPDYDYVYYHITNPFSFCAHWDRDQIRLTKATLTDDFYFTGRIDGPTLADAMALTTRALTITNADENLSDSEWIYFDYMDVGTPAGDYWQGLRNAVLDEDFNDPAWRFPWMPFESEDPGMEATPNCTMRFSYYHLTGWNNMDWSGNPPGSRIIGFAFNSFGATTVRSTTAHNGRYVPNALFNGGFAAAVGATAEPWASTCPDPSTIVWCLSEGWTVSEAFFRSNTRVHWMWGVIGDPLLRVPHWYNEGRPVFPINRPPNADAGPDQTVTDWDGDGIELVTLDGSGSYDVNNDTLSYSWRVYNDTMFGVEISTEVCPTIPFDIDSHTLRLYVSDGQNEEDMDMVTIDVIEGPEYPPDPDASIILLTDESQPGLNNCPNGDADPYQSLQITVIDTQGNPIANIPTEYLTINVNPADDDTEFYGDVLSCTFSTDQLETDDSGQISFDIVGDTSINGAISIEVGVLGVSLTDSVILPCNTFDLNLDGWVHLNDFTTFSGDYGTSSFRSDFDFSGWVTMVDFSIFAIHFGHQV